MWNFLKYSIWKQWFTNQDTKCWCFRRCFWAAQILGCYILPESRFSFLWKWQYSELLTLVFCHKFSFSNNVCDKNILFCYYVANFFASILGWQCKVQIFFALKIFWQQVTNDKMHLVASYAINCKKIHLTHFIAFNSVWGIQSGQSKIFSSSWASNHCSAQMHPLELVLFSLNIVIVRLYQNYEQSWQ